MLRTSLVASATAAMLLATGPAAAATYFVATAAGSFVTDTETLPFELTLALKLNGVGGGIDLVNMVSFLESGDGSRAMNATFTLDGIEYALSGTVQGDARQSASFLEQILVGAGGQFVIGANSPPVPLPMEAQLPPAGNICETLTCYGSATISAAGLAGQLSLTSYSAFISDALPSNVAAIPEPATWALMIAGFGLAGAGLRQRRAAVA